MTNAVEQITNSISPINGLDVVNAVNGFYSSAFNHTIWLLGILITILGFAIPAVYFVLARIQLKIREKKLEEKFETKFRELEKAGKNALKQEFERIEKDAKNKMVLLEGSLFYVLGNTQCEKGDYKGVLTHFAKTLKKAVEAECPQSFQVMIRFVTENVLPKMKKQDFENLNAETEFNEALDSGYKIPASNLLDLDIEAAKKSLAAAKAR